VVFSARQHYLLSAHALCLYAIARPSLRPYVRLPVRRVYHKQEAKLSLG